ncbi:hypothetical protein LUZ60_002248 [Juncus effusus]|nr:hypothetical protein LUZ60_002248 [Juncus effusus]
MNLIVFEQCNCRKQTRPLTSYAVLMGCLIKKPRDALILKQGGIIENQQTDEGVAMFFDQVRSCAHLDYDGYHLAPVLGDVKKCWASKRQKCRAKWQKYREKLCHDYFSSPWAIISFFAAILLLFLTATQSVYGVLGYYKQAN